jgi:thiamine biosynthesis lipoprotein
MGMPVQLEIVDSTATHADYEMIFDYLTTVDERFSTYKETSEISKINRGEITVNLISREMEEVFRLGEQTSKATGGYFSVHTPAGIIDPSGLVKGWAIQNAAELLKKRGFKNFYLEIAGDIQTHGQDAEGNEWSIGIQNPFAQEEIVKVVYPKGKGIATSGTYIRGSHLYDPLNSSATEFPFMSLTVLGPNVYEADRFATAAFVMGTKGLYFIDALEGFEAYGIDSKGIAHMTRGFESYTTISCVS